MLNAFESVVWQALAGIAALAGICVVALAVLWVALKVRALFDSENKPR